MCKKSRRLKYLIALCRSEKRTTFAIACNFRRMQSKLLETMSISCMSPWLAHKCDCQRFGSLKSQNGGCKLPCCFHINCTFVTTSMLHNVTCFKAVLSLVVWIFSIACCRAFTAHHCEKKQLPSTNCDNVWIISNMFDPCNCCCMRWKLRRSPPHTVQPKERFDAILIACVENCMLSQRSAAGLTFS